MTLILPDGVNGEAEAGRERLPRQPEPQTQGAHVLCRIGFDASAGGPDLRGGREWRGVGISRRVAGNLIIAVASTRAQLSLARSSSARECGAVGMALTSVGLAEG
jgi:hypothetical protein